LINSTTNRNQNSNSSVLKLFSLFCNRLFSPHKSVGLFSKQKSYHVWKNKKMEKAHTINAAKRERDDDNNNKDGHPKNRLHGRCVFNSRKLPH